MTAQFYTYLHVNAAKVPFYVGKGTADRAYRRAGRSREWAAAASDGYQVQILAHWQTEAEAFAHEVFLIETLRLLGRSLANLTPGGEGVVGVKKTDAFKAQMSLTLKATFADIRIRRKLGKGVRMPTGKKILCVNTGQVFANANAAAAWVRTSIRCKACGATVRKCAETGASYRGYRFKTIPQSELPKSNANLKTL